MGARTERALSLLLGYQDTWCVWRFGELLTDALYQSYFVIVSDFFSGISAFNRYIRVKVCLTWWNFWGGHKTIPGWVWTTRHSFICRLILVITLFWFYPLNMADRENVLLIHSAFWHILKTLGVHQYETNKNNLMYNLSPAIVLNFFWIRENWTLYVHYCVYNKTLSLRNNGIVHTLHAADNLHQTYKVETGHLGKLGSVVERQEDFSKFLRK